MLKSQMFMSNNKYLNKWMSTLLNDPHIQWSQYNTIRTSPCKTSNNTAFFSFCYPHAMYLHFKVWLVWTQIKICIQMLATKDTVCKTKVADNNELCKCFVHNFWFGKILSIFVLQSCKYCTIGLVQCHLLREWSCHMKWIRTGTCGTNIIFIIPLVHEIITQLNLNF